MAEAASSWVMRSEMINAAWVLLMQARSSGLTPGVQLRLLARALGLWWEAQGLLQEALRLL